MTSGAPAEGATAVLVVVPNGTCRPEPLAAAIHSRHPAWRIAAVWAGDPQLRPQLADGLAWWDGQACGGAGFSGEGLDELAAAGTEPHTWEWRGALAATRAILADGAARVVLLWAGAVAVLDAVDALVAADEHPLTVVPRVLGPLPLDDCSPTERDLLTAGPFSTTVAVFTRRPDVSHLDVTDWLDRALVRDPEVGVGPWLARAADAFGATVCRDERIGAGAWRWPTPAVSIAGDATPAVSIAGDATPPVALLDVPSFDPQQPWVLDPQMVGPARIEVIGETARADALTAAGAQLAGRRDALRLPGGVTIDATVRSLVRNATTPPPQPWSQAPAFRRWLEQRYWPALHASRPDLHAAFPEPVVRDADAFRAWSRSAFAHDDLPFLLGSDRTPPRRLTVAPTLREDGLNVVGYLTRESSLGDVARRLLDGLASASIPVSTIAYQRTASPILESAEPPLQRIAHETSLAIVTADQFPLLARDHPELFAATRRMIGYWFWELEHIPEAMRAAITLVDEIWAGSRFVADAFAAVSRVPVRHVPIPIPEPFATARRRSSFAPLAAHDGRFVFMTAFDHLSVTERKNPLGSIEAFRRAFAPDEGPLLVIKTMNGRIRWTQHQRVLAAASTRPDVIVWDEQLSRPDQMALVRAADCLVSLHRSEGLGLHLAEAMWLCTPTIATHYSGNVDFMDDSCALLVGFTKVRVEGGQGVYPASATWADPDLDQAAQAMRSLVADPLLHGRLSVAGRARMAAQQSLRQAAEHVATLLGPAHVAQRDRRQ